MFYHIDTFCTSFSLASLAVKFDSDVSLSKVSECHSPPTRIFCWEQDEVEGMPL